MKKLLSAAAAIAAAAFIGLSANAQAQHKVYDSGDILTAQEENALEELAEKLTLTHGVDAVICTEHTLTAAPEERAKSLFSSLDAGAGEKRDGVLLLIWFENDVPNYYFYENGWADEVFTQYASERVESIVAQDIEKRDFAAAAKRWLSLSDKLMTAQEKGRPYGENRPLRSSADYLRIWIVWLCVGAVCGAAVCAALVARTRGKSQKSRAAAACPEKNSFSVSVQRDILLYTIVQTDDGKERL